MIKILNKIVRLFLHMVDWGELLNGIVFMLLGTAFTYHYGYQVVWQNLIHILLWYLFYKLAIYCLNAIFSGELEKVSLDPTIHMKPAEFKYLLEKYFWVMAILFLAMSFVPLAQMISQNELHKLSLLIITLIYLGDLALMIDRIRYFLSGFQELLYGFVTAFLLPSLYFSLTKDYLKSSLITMIFPLFLQLIAWKIGNNLELRRLQRSVAAASMIGRSGTSPSLTMMGTLLVLGSLTMFMDQILIPISTKLMLLPFGLVAAWLVFRSIKRQNPYWGWALFLTRLLPLASAFSMMVSLWNH